MQAHAKLHLKCHDLACTCDKLQGNVSGKVLCQAILKLRVLGQVGRIPTLHWRALYSIIKQDTNLIVNLNMVGVGGTLVFMSSM
jgi:hypothetical protein